MATYSPGNLRTGDHSIAYFPENVAGGVYVARLQSHNRFAQEKIVYLK